MGLVNTYRPKKKFCHAHFNAREHPQRLNLSTALLKSVYRPHYQILKSLVVGALKSRFAACVSRLLPLAE